MNRKRLVTSPGHVFSFKSSARHSKRLRLVLLLASLTILAVLFSTSQSIGTAALTNTQHLSSKDADPIYAGKQSTSSTVQSMTQQQKIKYDKVPKIMHHMHSNLDALSPTQSLLRNKCIELHPDWQFIFWDDEKLFAFIEKSFPSFYPTWLEINPFIKKLDTSRYMIMHHYGGVYLDVDMECVTNLDSLFDPLPAGAAWVGDYPEPSFLASSPGNMFWLHALDRIKRVWNQTDAWHSTGPSGLNDVAIEYVMKHGYGVLVPFSTNRKEENEFMEFIKYKDLTVPWFELSNSKYVLEGQHQNGNDTAENATNSNSNGNSNSNAPLNIWMVPPGPLGIFPTKIPFPASTTPISADMTLGFIANELLDPTSCNTFAMAHCMDSFCNQTWPFGYVIHHCMNTWRFRIGDS